MFVLQHNILGTMNTNKSFSQQSKKNASNFKAIMEACQMITLKKKKIFSISLFYGRAEGRLSQTLHAH